MPVFESSRKVQIMGSSLAMTLPALFVKANEIEKGSEMNVIYGLNGVLVITCWEDHEVTGEHLKDILDDIYEKTKVQNENQKI